MAVPAFLPPFVAAGSASIAVSLLFGLGVTMARAGWPKDERRAALRAAVVLLAAWLGVAVFLAWQGVYKAVPDQPPTIQFGILIPIAAGLLLIWRSSTVSRAIDAVEVHELIAVQFYRVLGGVFLVLTAMGEVPGLFAWPAGTGDLLIGLAAPWIASRYRADPKRAVGLVVAWNIVGLVDLVVAVGTGFLTSPSPFFSVSFGEPNLLISAYPLVMIPTFLVPVSVLLHVVALIRLARAREK